MGSLVRNRFTKSQSRSFIIITKLLKTEFTECLQSQKLTFNGIFRFRNSGFMKTSYATEVLRMKMLNLGKHTRLNFC